MMIGWISERESFRRSEARTLTLLNIVTRGHDWRTETDERFKARILLVRSTARRGSRRRVILQTGRQLAIALVGFEIESTVALDIG